MPSQFKAAAAMFLALSGIAFAQQKALPISVDARVVNTPAEPVPVTVMNQAAGQVTTMFRSQGTSSETTVVPRPVAGRRFIVKHISMAGLATAPPVCSLSLVTHLNGGTSSAALTLFITQGGNGVWAAHESVLYVVADDQTLTMNCPAGFFQVAVGGQSESAQ